MATCAEILDHAKDVVESIMRKSLARAMREAKSAKSKRRVKREAARKG
jgi:hypothetical protein